MRKRSETKTGLNVGGITGVSGSTGAEGRNAKGWISEHSRAHQDDIPLSRTRSNFLSWLRGWEKATDKMPRRNDGKISEFPFVSLIYPFPSHSISLIPPSVVPFCCHPHPAFSLLPYSLTLCIDLVHSVFCLRLVRREPTRVYEWRKSARARASGRTRSRSSRGNIKNRANVA